MSYTRAMAEFAWKARERGEPEDFGSPMGGDPEEEYRSFVLRWVKRPDGRHEQVELPLTPELFLNPRADDTIVQGPFHGKAILRIGELLDRHFSKEEDVELLLDVKLVLGRGLPGPAPDVAVVRGLKDFNPRDRSYRVAKYGVPPCLVIEVLSPDEARIRRVDEVRKVGLYARAGIQEYLLVDPPREANGDRYRLRLYRLGPHGRYDAIEPDEREHFRSETADLSFAVSPEGDRIMVFDPEGNPILRAEEEAEARKAERRARQAAERKADREAKARQAEQEARQAAEQRARAEQDARQAAEAELARLRAEIERFKKGTE
jgi:Uma2 family endonuclease